MNFLSLQVCAECFSEFSLRLPFRNVSSPTSNNTNSEPVPRGRGSFSSDGTRWVWKGPIQPKALAEIRRSKSFNGNKLLNMVVWATFSRDDGDAVARELAELIRCCPRLQTIQIFQFQESALASRQNNHRSTSSSSPVERAEWLLEAMELSCLELRHLTFLVELYASRCARTDSNLGHVLGTLSPRLQFLNIQGWKLLSRYEVTRSLVLSGLRFASQLNSVQLCRCRLNDETLEILSGGLASTVHLETLLLDGNELSSESLPVVGNLLNRHTKLRTLSVGNQWLFHRLEKSGDPKHGKRLLHSFLSALEKHESLKELSVPGWMDPDCFVGLFDTLTRNKVLSKLSVSLSTQSTPEVLDAMFQQIPHLHITHLIANDFLRRSVLRSIESDNDHHDDSLRLNESEVIRSRQAQFRSALFQNQSLVEVKPLGELCGSYWRHRRQARYALSRNQTLQQLRELLLFQEEEQSVSVPLLGLWPYWLAKVQQHRSKKLSADMLCVALNHGLAPCLVQR